jgi:chromosome segregation ATPase
MSGHRQGQWPKWDQNDDRKLESRDLMASFDKNSDGVLDGEELELLTLQLRKQIEYSNSLMANLQSAEESQLALQKEVSIASENVSKHAAAAEEARKEAGTLRRKLKISQEICDRMTNQAKEYRIHSENFKASHDEVVKENIKFRELLEDVTAERSRLQRELTKSNSQTEKIKIDAEKAFREFQKQNTMLRETHAANYREANELRSKMAPLEDDRISLRERIVDLEGFLEETNKSLKVDRKATDDCTKRNRELKMQVESFRDSHSQIEMRLHDAVNKYELEMMKCKELENRNETIGARVAVLEGETSSLSLSLHRANSDTGDLRREISSLTQEIQALESAKISEQERANSKVLAIQVDFERTMIEERKRNEESLKLSSAKSSDANLDKSRAEKKYQQAQEDIASLHNLLKENKENEIRKAEAWRVECKELEKINLHHQTELVSSSEKVSELQTSLSTLKEEYTTNIRELKKEMIQRGRRFVDVLQEYEERVSSYRDEFSQQNDIIKDLCAHLLTLQKQCTQIKTEHNGAIMALLPELDSAYRRAFSKTDLLEEAVQDAKDNTIRESIAKSEERSRVLFLEEKLSQLTHHKSNIEQENNSKVSELSRTIEALQEQLMHERDGKKELEAQGHKMQHSLDLASTEIKELQKLNQTLHVDIGDKLSRQSNTKQEAEDKAIQLAAQLRRTIQERDAERKSKDSLTAQLNEVDIHSQNLQADIQQLSLELSSKARDCDELKAKFSRSALATGDTQNMYHKQLEQAQTYAKTLQEQKAELVSNNTKLNEELRYYQSQTLKKY